MRKVFKFTKKQNIRRLILTGGFLSLLFSCAPKHKPVVVTEKIRYDVTIKSPDPDYDWWVQNIEGPERDKIIRMIIEGAKTGKYKAYDYFFQPISPDDVRKILSDTLKRTYQHQYPPYDLYDTVTVYNIKNKDVLRLRFMEEWRIDPETMQFEKIVKGIAPVAKRIDENGNVRWQPLFWLVPDPANLKKLQRQ